MTQRLFCNSLEANVELHLNAGLFRASTFSHMLNAVRVFDYKVFDKFILIYTLKNKGT